MRRIGKWIDADNAFWIGVVRITGGSRADRDPMSGWRVRAIHYLDVNKEALRRKQYVLKRTTPDEADAPRAIDPGTTTSATEASWSNTSREGTLDPGATNRALVAGVGTFRAYILSAGTLVDLEAFKQTAHYDYFYRQPGVSDRLWVLFPLNEDAESVFCFDKYGERRRFDSADLELASHALRGIKWFHRTLMISHGMGICEEPLTSAERRVIHGLLSGASEKSLAEQLKLSPGTVHQYATRVYRKFGVKGRADFMSVWLAGSS